MLCFLLLFVLGEDVVFDLLLMFVMWLVVEWGLLIYWLLEWLFVVFVEGCVVVVEWWLV